MEAEAERCPLGVFTCQLCALTAPYSYVGQKPPDTHSVILLEESYIMKDPFTSDKDRFLVLGSKCSLCSRLVCVGPVMTAFLEVAGQPLGPALPRAVLALASPCQHGPPAAPA
ncbi:cysteine-rich DPF motif domain-containing protein 1 isoform X2 [Mirounga angustirostris]|uniref:cysteine-rich DPF motif domain-containing protein 1 isoform X2 n=1 Tax=Mirounga angustirostris TaxID=9716 RepID=UPI001E68D5F2